MTATQAARLWGITSRRVRILCEEGRIPGAKQEIIDSRNTWTMPDDSTQPEKIKPGKKAHPL